MKSAFNWDIYKNRKTALEYLKRNNLLIDTVIETEDKSAFELVHSQVISAFGNKLNDFIQNNGYYVDSYKTYTNRYGHILLETVAINPNSKEISDKRTLLKSLKTIDDIGNDNDKQIAIDTTANIGSRWPGKIKLICLPRVNKYTLNILVECAYTGFIRTDLSSGGIWQVLEVACHYEMLEVIRACCAFLIKNLDRSNCLLLYNIGIKHRHPLQRCAWHKIRANFEQILAIGLGVRPIDLLTDLCDRHQFISNNSRPFEPVDQSTNFNGLLPIKLLELDENANSLTSVKFEHFEALLMHDKLNVSNEESVWHAIKLWCQYNLAERADKLASLLPCIRFARLKSGKEFVATSIWRDPLILQNHRAQQELAILDRNYRDLFANGMNLIEWDGNMLPCALNPRQVRPRTPHSILLAVGGWRQGQPTDSIESYDSNCNLWFEHKQKIMIQLAYHGLESINGLLYICGGTNGTDILNEVFTFNPVSCECQQMPSMREARCYVSTAYLNGYLYAMGGHNGSQRMRSVEKLELNGGEVWFNVNDMNTARSDASACVHESRIYIAGGLNDQALENSVEFFNPEDQTWTFIAAMSIPRTSFSLVHYQNSLLAIGGNNGFERLSSVERYNFTTRTWSFHSQMLYRRSTFSATLLNDSKLVVVGGYNGHSPFSQVEWYDEATKSWKLLKHIRYDRSGLKVVAVNDLPNAADYTFLGSKGPNPDQSETMFEPAMLGITARARNRLWRSVGSQGSTGNQRNQTDPERRQRGN